MRLWHAIITPGLEPVLARELDQLGVRGEIEPGAVAFHAPLHQGARLVSELRTAGGLRLVVATGRAHTLSELSALVRRADWRPLLRRGSPIEVHTTSKRSRLRHRETISRKAGFAIKDAQRKLPPGPRSGALPQRVHLRIEDDQVTVSLDAAGERLHRRGWRTSPGKAPIRENLGAAMLLMAGWDGSEALVDPFCGAGTLVIEAALLAAGRPPWIDRRFAAEDWPAAGPSPRPRAGRSPALPPILGADKDPRVLTSAMDNARRAHVRLDWRHTDVAELQPPAPLGLVVANPPYGERLGQTVGGVYAAFGRTLRGPFQGWRAIFLAPSAALAHKVHRDAQQLTSFANGGIRVGVWTLDPDHT